MIKYLYLVGVMCCTLLNYSMGQSITLTDQQDLKPVADAFIYNAQQSVQLSTNHLGKAEIGALKGSQLFIQHPSYQSISISWEELQKADWKIRLQIKTYSLDEVVISSSRWEESQRDIVNQVAKINARDIAFANAPTTADVITRSGQVYVQKSQLGGGSPMLRGFSANSILLVIDGVRMNNAIYRSGNLQNIISVDANDLESAEVLFGPSSVLYGSDALGGVINFSTFSPRFLREDSTRALEGGAYVRYGSAMQEKTGHFDLNLATKYVAMATSFTLSDFGDLSTGRNRAEKYGDFGLRNWYSHSSYLDEGLQDPSTDTMLTNPNPNILLGSGYRQWNFQHKISAKLSENLKADYGFYFTSSTDIPRYDRLVALRNGNPRFAEWNYGPQSWEMHRVGLHHTRANKLYSQAKLIVSRQRLEESRIYRIFKNPNRIKQTEYVSITTVNLDFKKEFLNKSEFYYGIEYLLNLVDSHGSQKNLITREGSEFASRYPDGGNSVKSYSAYSQWVYKPNEMLTVSSGLRFNRYTLNSIITNKAIFNVPFNKIDLANNAITGSLGAVLNIDTWRLNANIASGFRSPNVDDVAKVFEGVEGAIMVPNPELGPEYSYSAELGISKTIHDKLILNGSIYYTIITDAIERRYHLLNGKDSLIFNGDTLRVMANVNIGRANIFGFTLNALADINHFLSFSTTFTYTQGQDITNNIPLRHIPPAFGRSALILKLNNWRSELYAEYAGLKPLSGLPADEAEKVGINYTQKGTLSWATLNFKTSYQINKNLQIQGGIENIFDTFYHTFASGIASPGRNFSITIRGNF